MIFLTVGSVDPFDRLVQAVDAWAGRQASAPTLFGQIAQGGAYRPRHFPCVDFLTQTDYRKRFLEAELVISHAGTGSIITALELGKRILIMPKLASLGEQRNEHQLATARHFARWPNVTVIESEEQCGSCLDRAFSSQDAGAPVDGQLLQTSSELLTFVNRFIAADRTVR